MKRSLPVAALVLAACNSQPDVSLKNASVSEVAQKAKAEARELRIQPGEWSHRSEVRAFEVEGAKDPQVTEVMKRSFAKTQQMTYTSCVTPEQANNPRGELFRRTDRGDCRYEHFKMGGGRIDAKLVCRPREGGETSISMAGRYAAASYEMDSDMTMTVPKGPFGTMRVKSHSMGGRIGPCKTDSIGDKG